MCMARYNGRSAQVNSFAVPPIAYYGTTMRSVRLDNFLQSYYANHGLRRSSDQITTITDSTEKYRKPAIASRAQLRVKHVSAGDGVQYH